MPPTYTLKVTRQSKEGGVRHSTTRLVRLCYLKWPKSQLNLSIFFSRQNHSNNLRSKWQSKRTRSNKGPSWFKRTWKKIRPRKYSPKYAERKAQYSKLSSTSGFSTGDEDDVPKPRGSNTYEEWGDDEATTFTRRSRDFSMEENLTWQDRARIKWGAFLLTSSMSWTPFPAEADEALV